MLSNTALPLLLGLLLASTARGQGFGFSADPYQPYNFQYAPFITPIFPGPLDYGNRPGQGIRGANQFEAYLNSLQTSAASARAGSETVGVPYYQPNRAYDRDFGRIYQPNKAADQRFETVQASLNQLYFEYLREKDPKKRAAIFRAYSRAQNRARRELASPRGMLGAQPATRSTPRQGRAPSPESTTGARDRDLLATPPPAIGETTRSRTRSTRSSASSLLGPAPSPLRSSRGSIGPGGATSSPDLDRLTPSQVLDRATRSNRSRIAPRPRGPGVDLSSPPPTTP